jgi:hypothetical protein
MACNLGHRCRRLQANSLGGGTTGPGRPPACLHAPSPRMRDETPVSPGAGGDQRRGQKVVPEGYGRPHLSGDPLDSPAFPDVVARLMANVLFETSTSRDGSKGSEGRISAAFTDEMTQLCQREVADERGTGSGPFREGEP